MLNKHQIRERIQWLVGWTVSAFIFAFVHFAVYFGIIDLKSLTMAVGVAILVSMVEVAYFLSERFRNMINSVFSYCLRKLRVVFHLMCLKRESSRKRK